MSKAQVPMEKLDSYERELCESEDPADHTALLMRLMVKNKGLDPDSDWRIVDSHMDFSSCDSIDSEECQIRPEAAFKSITSEEVEDGKRIVVVEPNKYLGSLIRGTGDWQQLISVDEELGVIKHIGVTLEGLVRITVGPLERPGHDRSSNKNKEQG